MTTRSPEWRDEWSQEPEPRCSGSKLQVFVMCHLIASYRTLNVMIDCIIAKTLPLNYFIHTFAGSHDGVSKSWAIGSLIPLTPVQGCFLQHELNILNAAFWLSGSLKFLCRKFKLVLNPALSVPLERLIGRVSVTLRTGNIVDHICLQRPALLFHISSSLLLL